MADRNNRIRLIRRHFDLTQQEFADRIGVKRNTIASYETGRNIPIDSVVSLICREFGISEAWLRTGEGEMLDPHADDALENLAREKGLSMAEVVLIEKFLNLKPEVRRALVDYAVEVGQAIRDADDEAEAEQLKQEYLREKKAEAESSASAWPDGEENTA